MQEDHELRELKKLLAEAEITRAIRYLDPDSRAANKKTVIILPLCKNNQKSAVSAIVNSARTHLISLTYKSMK